MGEKNNRRTDLGMEEDPVRDALGALERRLRKGDEFEYRKSDDQVFRMLIEQAANKFALRVEEVLEDSSGQEDEEPLGLALLRNGGSGEAGEREAVDLLLSEAIVGNGLGCGEATESVPESQGPSREVAKEPVAESQESSEAALSRYKSQYNKLPRKIKSRCTWGELRSRLDAKEGHYLDLAMDMQDGGELVYVDKNGDPVFKDGGVEPVMKGMNYNDAREALYGKDYEEGTIHHGYEMPNSIDEVRKIEELTKRPFVASDNGEECRSTWMESKKNPSLARYAYSYPYAGRVNIYDDYVPMAGDPRRGVVRLLRVKKMA